MNNMRTYIREPSDISLIPIHEEKENFQLPNENVLEQDVQEFELS